MSEYIAKAPIEPRDYRVVFLIQKNLIPDKGRGYYPRYHPDSCMRRIQTLIPCVTCILRRFLIRIVSEARLAWEIRSPPEPGKTFSQ